MHQEREREREREKKAVSKAVDFDALRELLGDVAEGLRERYQFTWPGKREAKAEARRPIRKTMIPCPEKSVNWDTTENLYIEGDNLDALKILRETYAGKVKMIYIDPPYNTGHDFIYDDNFSQTLDEHNELNGEYDREGFKLVTNTESNGRFHSDWCSMILPRLILAKDMLTSDGVIFISIDDYEVKNMRSLADEVFGASIFIAQLIWERAYSPKNDAKFISNSHDYILMYAKRIEAFTIGRLPRNEEADSRYKNPDNDPRGVWMSDNMTVKSYTASCDYPIETPSGRIVEPPAGRCWRLSKKAFLERLQDNRIWFGSDGSGVPRIKRFLSELKYDGMAPTSIMFYKEVGHSQEGAKELVSLFGGKGYFDGPKPVRLLKRLLTLANLSDGDIAMDFFSGSASTAHALFAQEIKKNARYKFILVQVPEPTDEKRESFNDGYSTICEIGEDRIRRAGAKITAEVEQANTQLKLGEEPKHVPDIGFRVMRIDSSNFKNVNKTPEETTQTSIFNVVDNVKKGRTDLDLLFEVLPKFRIPYSATIEEQAIAGKKCFIVNDGQLVACFDTSVSTDTIEEITKMEPLYAVMRDASMANDSTFANFEELFKTYSPDTVRRVI